MLLAQESRFGGHSLFIKEQQLLYVNNFIGIPPELKLSSGGVTTGKHVLGVEFTRESMGERHETLGTATLYFDDQPVAKVPFRTQPGHLALSGEGLSVGRDSGDAVSDEYTPQFRFTGGRIVKMEIFVNEDAYVDVEREFAAAMARD